LRIRSKPYILIKDIREIDVDYYIEKQVIPAAMRILEVLGVKESQLMEGKAGKSILDFFQ
jgi:replicative DNA polymerase I (EC 2.7.7.7)